LTLSLNFVLTIKRTDTINRPALVDSTFKTSLRWGCVGQRVGVWDVLTSCSEECNDETIPPILFTFMVLIPPYYGRNGVNAETIPASAWNPDLIASVLKTRQDIKQVTLSTTAIIT